MRDDAQLLVSYLVSTGSTKYAMYKSKLLTRPCLANKGLMVLAQEPSKYQKMLYV